MSKIFPCADGFLILKDVTDMSPGFLDYCIQHTMREIRGGSYAKCVDLPLTKLLYEQIPPFSFTLNPNRFVNELRDAKTMMRAIHKYKRRYPHSICTYQDEWITDDEIPEYAKKIGICFYLQPYFLRIRYAQKGKIETSGRIPSQSLFCDVTPTNFNIVLNKVIPVISDIEAPSYHRAYKFITQTINNESHSLTERNLQIQAYLKTLSPAERSILKYIFYESSNSIDLKSSVAHELKHVINEVLLKARRAKPSCGRLNAEQMFRLFCHDEISASSQEVLNALRDLYLDKRTPEDSVLYLLIPIHYGKYLQADKQECKRMLQNPQPLIRELSQNWLKYNYSFYQKQFKELFEELESSYPSCLWSRRPENDPKEYLLQKDLIYTLEVLNPETGEKSYLNAADAVDDALFTVSKRLKPSINRVNTFFKQKEQQLLEAGITEQLIEMTRRRNYDYLLQARAKQSDSAHWIVDKTLHKYMLGAREKTL